MAGQPLHGQPDVKADPTDWTMVRSWKFDREGASERWRRQIYGV